MKRNIFIAILIVIVAGYFYSFEQSQSNKTVSISGKIIDTNGKALTSVLVTIVKIGTQDIKKVLSDDKGLFKFEKIFPGKYDFQFSMAGYKSVYKKNVSLSISKIIFVNAVLASNQTQKKSLITINVRKKDEVDFHEVQDAVQGGVVGGVLGGVRNATVKGGMPRARKESYSTNYRNTSYNTEEYDRIYENRFLLSTANPLSTFSIDVDTASYANIRRFIKKNSLPPKDAVRIEEMINYFNYEYPKPKGRNPFSIFTEISSCPWNEKHKLIHIGLQGKKMEKEEYQPSNLVFLIDVSGSMRANNKLPLLKSAFKLLVNQLGGDDRVSVVVYAGAAGVVLPSTSQSQKEKIIKSIEKLRAGGSTAGGQGINLAYKIAKENFIKKGNNRVILATDGDFNVGTSSTSDLVRLIEEKRKDGIFLTVLGFGMGNYKDNRMEQLANKGNGNYHYIDGLLEAKKVFIDDMLGTLFTIAKDVKIQIEFNPAKVKAYRLVGYENRMLKKEDFADDTIDAGELGAGHTVTALYEIIPYGSKEEIPGMDDLKYQQTKISSSAFKSKEIMTVKLRYKRPDGEKSRLLNHPVIDRNIPLKKASDNFIFSAAVSQFGMILRDSKYKGHSTLENILKSARQSRGEDSFGYRAEFINLVEICTLLDRLK